MASNDKITAERGAGGTASTTAVSRSIHWHRPMNRHGEGGQGHSPGQLDSTEPAPGRKEQGSQLRCSKGAPPAVIPPHPARGARLTAWSPRGPLTNFASSVASEKGHQPVSTSQPTRSKGAPVVLDLRGSGWPALHTRHRPLAGLESASGVPASALQSASPQFQFRVTQLVEIYLHQSGVTSALDLAGWFDCEAEVRQSARADWQAADIASLLSACLAARRCSSKEVTSAAGAFSGMRPQPEVPPTARLRARSWWLLSRHRRR